ncbi:MAG TPA: hypothetical protein VGJ00_00030 [Rhabdochlamydiaceae bacterium]|jgi:hypothetical protein
MFQRATLYSFTCFALMTLVLGLLFVRMRSTDVEACRRLQVKDKASSSQGLINTTHQQRKNVKKEIYFLQEDNSRLHYRIFSQSSLLTMQPSNAGKKIALNEKLEKIQCWMQDKLYYSSPGVDPMQQVRFFEAEEGVYCYTSQQFLAQTVVLSLFRLPEHDLPQTAKTSPFLRGIAKDVSFAVSGKTPSFKAQHFKAELAPNLIER